MKRLIVTLIFVVFNSTLSCLAQLNPLSVSVTLQGEVKITHLPPCLYFYQSSLPSVIPTTFPAKVYNYTFRSDSDSIQESITTLNINNDNIMLFTFHSPNSIELINNLHQYKLNSWSNSRTAILTNFEHEIKAHAYYRTQAEQKLALKYNRKQLLKKMKLERTTISKEKKIFYSIWKFLYKKNRLNQIKNKDFCINYTYDRKGNLLSIISYSGNLKSIDKSYLCLDSLEKYHDTKVPSYKFSYNYESYTTEINEMVFYQYEDNKLVKMVSFSNSFGLQKTILGYDSLKRVNFYREFDNLGGIEMKFQYDANGKLKQRNERRKSDSYERGSSESEIMETYKYNSKKAINEVNCYYGSFHINGKNELFNKIKKSVIEYDNIIK
jgi:hypothetical protein